MDASAIIALVCGASAIIGTVLASTWKLASMIGDVRASLAAVAVKVEAVERDVTRVEGDVTRISQEMHLHGQDIAALKAGQ